MDNQKHNTLWLSFLGVTALPVLAIFIITLVVTRREFYELRRIYGPNLNPEMKESIFMILIFATGLILVANSLWMIWMKGLVIKPIRDIEAAAKRITQGDLDFTLVTQRNDEIGELCRDFEEMRRRLKASQDERLYTEQQQKMFISNICHDLKTPITSIQGYVEGIMDGVATTDEMRAKYLKTIYNKSNELNLLINELTMYNKLDMDHVPYNFSELNLKKYLDDCAVELEDELTSRGFSFDYEYNCKEDVRVMVDPVQFSKVIHNLIGNSVKYMDKEDKRIGLKVSDAGDSVEITVEDNGMGISADNLPRIFDRFYRGDSSRGKTKGSGIGLSIVKKITEDHGGRIEATSTEGEGTAMHIALKKYTGGKDGQSTYN